MYSVNVEWHAVVIIAGRICQQCSMHWIAPTETIRPYLLSACCMPLATTMVCTLLCSVARVDMYSWSFAVCNLSFAHLYLQPNARGVYVYVSDLVFILYIQWIMQWCFAVCWWRCWSGAAWLGDDAHGQFSGQCCSCSVSTELFVWILFSQFSRQFNLKLLPSG